MYKWDLEITLKNGTVVEGIANTDQNNSTDFFRTTFAGNAMSFCPIFDKSGKGVFYVCLGEIACVKISEGVK